MGRFNVKREKKPLIVICSEGGRRGTEYYYFKNFSNRNLRIQFSTGNNTDPNGMMNDLLKYIDNEDIKSEEKVKIFLVLDTDLNEDRINEILKIKSKCIKNNIEIITSAPTFEIWYLMHYRKDKLVFRNSKDVKKELNKYVNSYSETMDMYNITKDNINVAV